jgi:hypothetical protein
MEISKGLRFALRRAGFTDRQIFQHRSKFIHLEQIHPMTVTELNDYFDIGQKYINVVRENDKLKEQLATFKGWAS